MGDDGNKRIFISLYGTGTCHHGRCTAPEIATSKTRMNSVGGPGLKLDVLNEGNDLCVDRSGKFFPRIEQIVVQPSIVVCH